MTQRRRVLGLLGLGAWAGALAQPVGDAETQTLRALIEAQMQAFAASDAARAFGYASPGIQAQFGTAEVFMRMVRENYPMVYRHAARAYFKPERDGGAVLQKLRLTDAQGAEWIASYRLQRQAGGSWRIDGCVVVPATGRISLRAVPQQT
jgi:hypothetical protein